MLKDIIQTIPSSTPQATICITEVESVRNNIASLAYCSVDLGDITDYLTDISHYHFLSLNMENMEWNNPDALYLWVETGYRTPSGENIMISLLRQSFLEDCLYRGYFVGTAGTLVQSILKYRKTGIHPILKKYQDFCSLVNLADENPVKQVEIDVGEEDSDTSTQDTSDDTKFIDDDLEDVIPNTNDEQQGFHSLVATLTQQLLVNPFRSDSGVAYYLNMISARINELMNSGCESELIVDKTKKYVVVNSGLLNEYGNLIQILYEKRESQYAPIVILSSKQQLISFGFKKKDINKQIGPIRFADESLKFEATFEDFDISDYNIHHIVKERYGRIKTAIGGDNIPSEKLTQTIISELKKGLELCVVDSKYAKAIYSCKRQSVSWCLPCRIKASFQEKPELIMVIRQTGEFFSVKTVLPYDDDVYNKTKCMRLYSDIW